MKLAAGICTWQDGPALDACLESVRPYVDHVFTAEGAFAGFDTKGIDPGQVWDKQSTKRTALLHAAQRGGYDWLLQIDADEQLHRGDDLRRWLELWGDDCFPLGFYFEGGRDEGTLEAAMWKCVRVRAWDRVIAQGAYLRAKDGGEWCLMRETTALDRIYLAGLPYLTHHPELRPEGRRELRFNYLENLIEPAPFLPIWPRQSLTPIPVTKYAAAMYYCPGCGTRYATSGVCDNQHAPIELEALPAEAPAEVDPANGTEAAPAEAQAPSPAAEA